MLEGRLARGALVVALARVAGACGGGADYPGSNGAGAPSAPPSLCGTSTVASLPTMWGLQLAIAGRQVYYTGYGAGPDGHEHQLWSAPVGGGEPSLIWQGPSGILGNGLLVADGQAYLSSELVWGSGAEGVRSVPLAGGPASPRGQFGTACAAYGGMVIDDANVYAGSNGCSLGPGQILAVPRAGGATTTLWAGDVSGVGAAALALHGTDLYFLVDEDGDGDGNLMMLTAGAAAQPVATGIAHEAHGLATDGDGVYLSTGDTLYMLPYDGSHPVTLASQLHHPDLVAVDASGVYVVEGNFARGDTATVLRVPHDGGTPAVLASGQPAIFALALDDSAVYWASQTGGVVMRAGKCD
jgi:hypothetical protein